MNAGDIWPLYWSQVSTEMETFLFFLTLNPPASRDVTCPPVPSPCVTSHRIGFNLSVSMPHPSGELVPNTFELSWIRKIPAMSYASRLYSLVRLVGDFCVLCYRVVLLMFHSRSFPPLFVQDAV